MTTVSTVQELNTGDDWPVQITLRSKDSSGDLTTDDLTDETLSAALVTRDDDDATLIKMFDSISEGLSDRANGIIVFNMLSATTTTITQYGERYIQMQGVDLSGIVKTWRATEKILVRKTVITPT